MRKSRLALLLAALVVLQPSLVAAEDAAAILRGPDILPGRYEGAIEVGEGRSTPLGLRLIEGGGGLVDLPGQDIYGFPLEAIAVEGDRLAFLLGQESAGGGTIRFDAWSVAVSPAEPPAAPRLRLEGVFTQGGASGTFHLEAAQVDESAGVEFDVDARGGRLHGSLLVPALEPGASGAEPGLPLVVIVPGAGTTDRDGNNYSVPGRNDGLKALALALASRGIASYRYDKRGAGESYTLAGAEADSRFSDYVDDAVAVALALPRDGRFGRLILAGHTEGGLVAAAAAARLEDSGARLDGLALLCATGKTGVETVEEGLAETPEELGSEAEAIMAALENGGSYDNPSAYFAEFFRPSFQPWLASWFSYDVRALIARVKAPLALVQGNLDVQTSLADFALLAEARPDAPAFVLPSMNHVLKSVPPDLDENYASFSDPSYELAPGLADIVAALASGVPMPEGLPRYDGGKLQGAEAAPAAETGSVTPSDLASGPTGDGPAGMGSGPADDGGSGVVDDSAAASDAPAAANDAPAAAPGTD